MNKSTFTGRLATDVNYFAPKGDNKHGVARFRFAIDNRSKDAETVFINVVAFNNAEFARDHLKKGSRYLLTTSVKSSKDKDGKVNGVEFVLEDVDFIDVKKAAPSDVEEPMPVLEGDDDALPFN